MINWSSNGASNRTVIYYEEKLKVYDEIIKIVRPGEERPRPGATTISYFATNLEDLYKGLFYNVKSFCL